jgi:hypothetical protein
LGRSRRTRQAEILHALADAKPIEPNTPIQTERLDVVEGRFRDAITAGEIPSEFPVAERAIQVTDFARGLTMRALIGTPRKTLLRDAEEAADLVLLSRRGNAAQDF